MANTITNISLANTFGEWVSTTVQTVNELNYIGTADWRKASGTMYIDSTGVGLDVANNAYFRGQLIVTGIGSSLTVAKDAGINGTLYLNNTDLGHTIYSKVLDANGVANINFVNIVGSGLAANVSNNMFVGGTLVITGNTSTSANLTIAQDVTANNGTIGYDLNVGDDVTIGGDLDVSGVASIDGTTSIGGHSYVGQNLMVTGKIYGANIISNSAIFASTLGASTGTFTDLTVDGDFIVTGSTVYDTNELVMRSITPLLPDTLGYAAIVLNRGESTDAANANAMIRWDNLNEYWAIRDVTNPDYFDKIVTANDIVSINTTISTANTDLKNYVDTQILASGVSTNAVISTANTNMKNYVDSSNTAMKTYVDGNFLKTSGSGGGTVTLTNDITITGNLVINGTTTTVNTTTIQTTDSLIKLARNQTNTDVLDVGFFAPYQTGGFTRFTGLIRKAADKYYLTQGMVTEPTSNTITNFGTGYRATLDANFTGGSVSGLSSAIGFTDGGTGQTSGLAAVKGLLDQLPGQTFGYVLGTSGSGNYAWVPQTGGGGGGVTPGTTIISNRSSYTANGAAGYSGNSFSIPAFTNANQIRAYIDGVRQFESEYSLVSGASNTIIFTTTPDNGSKVLIEADGYYVNPYYANNITFTAPFGGIVSSANSIQLAIQDLETRKATLASPSFTGTPTSATAVTGTSNTMIATTAFVQTANSNMKTYVNNTFLTITAGAPKASPTLTGQPTSPTAAPGTSNTMIATTGFVSTALSNYATITSVNSSSANVQHMSLGVGTTSTGVNGEIVATDNITAYYSDERLKTRLGPIEDALGKVNQLSGFYHEANEVAEALGYTKRREVGVSAQEVQAVLPEVVAPAPIDNQYMTVRYERIVPLLIEAIKELNNKVEELQNQLNNK